MRKSPFLIILGLFVAVTLASSALAQPPRDDGDGRDGPPPRLTLTDAQKATWDKLWTEYQDRIYPIRSQLQDARLLYRLLEDQTVVNLEEAKKVIADMRRLRDQLRTEAKKFQTDLKASGLPEILGVHAKGHGFGHGGKRGRGGHGPGFGPGHGFKGHGPRFDRDRDRDRDWDRDRDRDDRDDRDD
jgi:Spy/CpxP family protein refolding chaperone